MLDWDMDLEGKLNKTKTIWPNMYNIIAIPKMPLI
jgi:hypothetical protein